MTRFRIMFRRFMTKRTVVKPTRVIVFTFLGLIAIGAVLLSLPISTSSGESCGILTSLFTSTSAICTTGLTRVSTEYYWSNFGQLVILILCQIGGLGFMSIVSIFYFLLNRKIGLRERLVLMESMNLGEIEGVVRLTKTVLCRSLTFEAVGAVILSICFIPQFGIKSGIWRGIFMAVSSFCSSGFAIVHSETFFSNDSTFTGNPIVLITMMVLIVLGSLGFYVWGDFQKSKKFKNLHVYSKLVLITTSVLILLGAMVYLIFETGEGRSLHDFSAGRRVLLAFFQSVSDRTAGIDAVGHLLKSDETKLLTLGFMFIGGSSGSTSGGVKTVTVAIIVLSMISTLRGKNELIVFGKKISQTQIIQAGTLVFVGLGVSIIFGSIVSVFNNFDIIDSLFETVSAYSTAGISVGIVEMAEPFTLILFIILMFFGKIGILSMSIAFLMKNRNYVGYTYPTERIIIG